MLGFDLMRSGFSLIELLVVIAIIGILAAVGVVGYNGYINATKDESTIANMNSIDRAFDQDYIALGNDLGGPSEVATGISKSDQCLSYIRTAVTNINNRFKNPHDQNVTFAVDLHKDAAASGVAVSALKPGQLGFQCANPSQPVTNSDFFVYKCSCIGVEDCTLHTFSQGDGSADTTQYESVVASADRWYNGNIKVGPHLPEWVCPKASYYN